MKLGNQGILCNNPASEWRLASTFGPGPGEVQGMAGDPEGAARRAQDGVAVSSGESSAATPKPALGSEGMTDPGIGSADVTSPGAARPITPKSDPSDAMTMAAPRGSGSGSAPHPIFSSIGATIFH